MTHPKRRAARYGNLTRGWDWRTTPELLAEAEKLRQQLGVDRTQLIEDAIRAYIEKHRGEGVAFAQRRQCPAATPDGHECGLPAGHTEPHRTTINGTAYIW